jgi:hypothetical protein
VVEEIAMATTPVAADVPGAPAPIGPIGRILGVFSSPKKTFADIARRPSWIAPLAVLMVVWMALNVTLARHVDWVEVAKDQIAKSKFASRQVEQLSDDQKVRAYEQGALRSKVSRYVRGIIGWPLLLLIISGIYLGAFKLIGGARINFALAFAITTFAHLPVGLKELISIPVVLLKDPASIDPENFLASNPAVIFANDLAPWQAVPLAFLDLFGIWALVLVAIGFSAADPKKLPFSKSLGIAGGITLTLMVFFTGLVWAFS